MASGGDDSALMKQISCIEDSSKIVCKQKEALRRTLDLEKLVDDLSNTGKFVHVATNAIVGAGPKYVDLQLEVQQIGYDIAKLCDKSAVAVSSFHDTADTIIATLESVYAFLLDGFESVAIGSLESLADMANEMATEAHQLKNEFEKEEKKVISAREKTVKKGADAALHEEKMKAEQKKNEENKRRQEKLIEMHYQLAEEAKKERKEYEEKEDEELSKSRSSPIELGICAIATAVLQVLPMFDASGINETFKSEKKASFDRASIHRENAMKKYEIEKEQRKLYAEELEKMSKFTQEIENCKNEADMAKIAVEALHQASGALKYLSTVMMQAAHFWECMEKHCRKLASPAMNKSIERVMKMNEIAKRKFWESQGFIKQAEQYHAQWMALRSVCGEYMLQIKETRAELYKHIRDNPTYEEARKRLPKMAKELQNTLAQAKQNIALEDAKAEEEKRREHDN